MILATAEGVVAKAMAELFALALILLAAKPGYYLYDRKRLL